MAKIGVFDSGIGGEAVANAVKKALPNSEIIQVSDKEHVPYGTKSPAEILTYVEPLLQNLVEQNCDVIVIACNTVSTTLIDGLRERIKTPLVSMVPMVKPAAERTKTKVIAVCATPTTLASKRYQELKDTYAKGIKVIEPDCSDWTYMIEHKQIEEDRIANRIEAALDQKADVIVLGCTHYHWIEDLINKIAAGRALVIQPEQPVIEQLKRVLAITP